MMKFYIMILFTKHLHLYTFLISPLSQIFKISMKISIKKSIHLTIIEVSEEDNNMMKILTKINHLLLSFMTQRKLFPIPCFWKITITPTFIALILKILTSLKKSLMLFSSQPTRTNTTMTKFMKLKNALLELRLIGKVIKNREQNIMMKTNMDMVMKTIDY